jgi:hypothetical protein
LRAFHPTFMFASFSFIRCARVYFDELMFSMSIHILDFFFFLDGLYCILCAVNLRCDGHVALERCLSCYFLFFTGIRIWDSGVSARVRLILSIKLRRTHLILSCEFGSGACFWGDTDVAVILDGEDDSGWVELARCPTLCVLCSLFRRRGWAVGVGGL